jgi:Domain of unknown function (DUF4105)
MRWWPLLVAIALATPGTARAGEETERPPDPAGTAPPPDGPPPIIELYTMGQGDLMFEKFGHAALCVTHTRGRRRTICYNYGTTNFDAIVPLFWGFLRGRSEFWVSTSSRRHMVRDYREADRTLWRQVLPLAPEQAHRLDALLRENAREENRYYRYHHYHDNCSSRVRDLIDQVTGGALSAASDAGPLPTYRELTRTGYAGTPELLLLSDLLLGREADQHPTMWQGMFLPDVLRAEVERRLGAAPSVVYQRRGPPFPSDPGMGGRWLWIALALAFAVPAALARRIRRQRLALAVAVFPLAFIGLVLWFLAASSTLSELRWNEVLLVFVPFDAAVPFLSPARRARYAAIRAGELLLVGLLLAVGVLHQPLWLLLLMPLLPMLLVALPGRALSREAAPSVAATS